MPKLINAEKDILMLLKDARFGHSINKIAKELNYSRTTISKYLVQMQKEGKVFAQDIGQYKVWHHQEGFYRKNYDCSIANIIFQPFYTSMMKNLPSYGIEKEQFKELGREISKDLDLFELVDTFVDLSASSLKNSNQTTLNELAHITMDIIDMIFSDSDQFTWHPPFICGEESFFILRMAGSDYFDSPAHFYLLSGLIQFQLEKKTKAAVHIHQIVEEEKLVDMKFQF